MNRRVPILGVALAAATVLSACSTFDDSVAKVGSSKISNETFTKLIDAFEDVCTPTADDECTGRITQEVLDGLKLSVAGGPAYAGDGSRFWIGYLIRQQLATATLKRLGGEVTAADTQAATDSINSGVAAKFPAALKGEIIDSVSIQTAITRVAQAPTPADLETTYSADPSATGALCLRHILVPTLAEAQDIEAELAAGTSFADLATQHSTDKVSAAAGGALGSDVAPCTALWDLVGNFDPAFLEGALHAKPGVPTEPVRSSFGWHIILARPYTEIADGLLAAVSADPARAAIYADFTSIPVTVSSRYGRWSPVAVQVLPND